MSNRGVRWVQKQAIKIGLLVLSALVTLVVDSRAEVEVAADLDHQGKVYLVMGSDTAIWNYPSNAPVTVDAYTRHPYYSQNSFTDPSQPSFKVMDPALRNHFLDSYGQPIKFTWWMMGGNIYRDAANLNVPVANTMTLHLMKQYHGAAIAQFGDELSLHYHTFVWSDANLDGKSYWNQPCDFEACRADFDVTLAQYLLEEGVFPVSFRSGWHFMDNGWQSYLNQLIPYCMHNNQGVYRGCYTNVGPVAGIEDWSRATSAFVPFHPATNDYQLPGDGPGWNVRSIKMQALNQNIMDQVFAQAAAGTDQVVCIWDHLPENFLFYLTNTVSLIQMASSNNPVVPFRYCTAVEAMQQWRGVTGQTPPVLDVSESSVGQTVTLAIHTSTALFQPQPFVCLRDAFQQYSNVTSLCVPAGTNSWRLTLPVPRNQLAKVGIAATDQAGNLATRILRYLPDDLYIDNLDPQYAEGQGNWISTNSAAWGTNARVARLTAVDTAQAQWSLPISRSGLYSIDVQVPAIANAASNVQFTVYAAGSNIHSVFFPLGIPADQWVSLGAPLLERTLSNVLEMTVIGASQSNTYAVADVVRLMPLADTNAPIISCSSNIEVACVGPGGAPVSFVVTATDTDDPRPAVICEPSSGTLFPPGTTTVTCTATDASFNSSSCTFTVTVDSTLPVITRELISQTNLPGATVSFNVQATSCGEIGYQWYFGTNRLVMATNDVLTIASVQLSDAGNYYVVLANGAGSVTSAVVSLTVHSPPTAMAWGAATTVNQPLRFTLDQFLGKISNPDGGLLTVTVSATSNTLGLVTMDGSVVTYVPPLNFAEMDSFVYTVRDDWGATASAEVEILVVSGILPEPQHLVIGPITNGFLVRFAGEAGRSYRIERSPDLAPPWITLDRLLAPLHGVVEYNDTNTPPGSMFYRIASP